MLYERVAGKSVNIPESRVVAIWRKCLRDGRDLLTENGETIRVLYPGRLNSGHGPDFLDAVIATDRGLLKGDIEVHTRSSGWWQHGHYLDPAYNRVIMHVVYNNDADRSVRLHDGRNIPNLSLDGLPVTKTDQDTDSGFLPCHNA